MVFFLPRPVPRVLLIVFFVTCASVAGAGTPSVMNQGQKKIIMAEA